MALQKQLVSYNFMKGIDTKSDNYQVSGKLLELENGVFQTEGEVRKRNGYSTIGASGSMSSGNAIASYNSEIVAANGKKLYSYATQTDSFIEKGLKTAVDVQKNSICKNNYIQIYANSAYHSSGLKLFTWIDISDNNLLKYSIIDSATGNEIVNNQTLGAYYASSVVSVGNYFVIILVQNALPDLYYISIPTTTLTPSSPVLISNTFDSSPSACVLNNTIYLAYYNTTTDIDVRTISSTLVVSAPTVVSVTSATNIEIAADETLNQLWIGYYDSPNVKYFVLNSSLGTVLAPTTVQSDNFLTAICLAANNGTGRIFYDSYDQTSGYPYSGFTFTDPVQSNVYFVRSSTITNTGTVTNNGQLIRTAFLYSRAIYHDSNFYAVVLHESELQNTYFLVNQDGKVVAKMVPGNGGPNQYEFLVNLNKLATNKFNFALIEKDYVTSVNGVLLYDAGVAEEIISFNDPMVSQNLGNNLHLSGGVLTMYDGSNVVEHGFNLFPENLGYKTLPYGGALAVTPSGQTYQYSQTYDWTDNQGQLHQSAPSVAKTIEIPATYEIGGITTTLGSPFIDVSPFEVKPGMTVAGPGIPANTYILSVSYTVPIGATMSANATATSPVGAGVTLSFGSQDKLVGNTLINKNIVYLNPDQTIKFYRMADFENGSTSFYFYDTSYLRVGQTVQNKGKITAINGNVVTLDTPSVGSSFDNTFLQIYVTDGASTATWVAGGAVITFTVAGSAARYAIGDLLYSSTSAFSTGTTARITFVNTATNQITIDSTMNARVAQTWSIAWPCGSVLKKGNSLAGTGLSGSPLIEAVSDDYQYLDFYFGIVNTGYVNISSNATSTNTSITYTVQNLNAVAWFLPNLCITSKITNPIVLSLWRTELNGSVFFRTSDSRASSLTLYNNISQNFTRFVDDLSDQELIGNDQLYTTGGVIENIEIPATSIITSYRSRLIGVPSESPYSVWYSKQVVPGNPVAFSDLFVQNIDQKGGPITGLATMDDKLILFKQSLIYYMVGDGPTATGINNDFTQPQLISTDSGCINKKSIVITPIGTMYQSAKGIYLLNRALEVKYIGAEVEDYNNFTITSAQLVSNFNQVRFTLDNGVTLMFDYYYQQWSVFTNYSAIDSVVIGASSSAATYYFIQSGGSVKKETNGQYLDDGSYIPLKIRTNWFSFAGLQGYERFYKVLILGHYHSPHSLNFKAYYDFSTTLQQDTTITVDSDPGVYQYRMFLNRQKCESVQFILQDSAIAPLGQGFALSAIAFEVGIKQGLNKMPAASSYG